MKTISTEDLRDRMFTVKSKDQGVTEVDDTSNPDNQVAGIQEAADKVCMIAVFAVSTITF